MHLKISSLILITLLLVQCKSASVGQIEDNETAIPVILLLADNVSPADLESLKSVEIQSMKRISRSQNQWIVNIVGEQETNSLLEKLKQDNGVKEVYLDKANASEPITNTKSGKSDPIKN